MIIETVYESNHFGVGGRCRRFTLVIECTLRDETGAVEAFRIYDDRNREMALKYFPEEEQKELAELAADLAYDSTENLIEAFRNAEEEKRFDLWKD